MSIRRAPTALLVSMLLSIGVAGTALAAKPTKVQLCHLNPRTETWSLITVVEKKVAAHLAHGDGMPGGAVPGVGGATFGDDCSVQGDSTIFAIAWVDRDGNHTYDESNDFLIAKLVDANLNRTLDAGDEVITGGYPLDFVPEQFSVFNVSTHTVDSVFVQAGRTVAFDADANAYNWETPDEGFDREVYEERVLDNSLVLIQDGHSTTEGDRILLDDTAPSVPAIERDLSQSNDTNDDFIDVFVLASG